MTAPLPAIPEGEALRPEFRVYGQRVVENARTLAATLAGRGIGIVGGGSGPKVAELAQGADACCPA